MQLTKSFVIAAVLAFTISSLCVGQSQEKSKAEPLKVGDKVTEFKLNSLNNRTIDSTKQFGENGRPAVLLFSRANW